MISKYLSTEGATFEANLMKYATNQSPQANNIKTLLFDDDKRSDNKDLRNVIMGHYRADYEHPVMNLEKPQYGG